MDFTSIVNGLPQAVLVAAILVVIFVKTTSVVVSKIEEKIEAKKGKEIKIFDHKKIWLSLFWCIIAVVLIAAAGFIAWRETPFYMFVIMGISTFCYEAIVKNFGL